MRSGRACRRRSTSRSISTLTLISISMVSRSNSSRFVLVLAWLVAMGAPLAPLAAQAPAPTAPPPPPLRLSFADAVRLASGEVPVVALATLRTTEADARVRQARAALLPSLSLGGAWVNRDFNSKSLGIPFPPQFNLPNPVPPCDNYDGRVTVTQTLFDWSSVARVRAAGAQADGSRAERGVTVEGAALTAALAYLRAARGQAAVAARQADSALAAELVGLAQAQKAAGVSGAIDVTRARTQLVTAEGLLIVARNQMDRARIDVTRALGLDPATPLTLTDSLASTLGAAEVPAERDAAVTAALAGRPDLGAELARGVAARRSGTAIRAERLPRVGVEADYGVNGLTGPSALSTRQVALQVTLPILDGFRREARAAEQDAVVRESQVRESDLRWPIAAEGDAALLGLAAVGVRRWIYSLSHVSTDNAQVDGHIIPILPKVGGYVVEVRTDENRQVKAGDTLVVLDDRDYKARLAQAEADLAVALAGVSNRARVGQAEAQVAQMQANAEKAHADLERIKPLAEKDIVPKQALDAAEAAARAADAGLAAAQAALLGADARVAAARAARDQAALNLSYTRITAPSEGVVSKKSVEIGQLVQRVSRS